MKSLACKTFYPVILAILCQVAAVAHAEQAAQPTELNIPAQPLRDALTALGRQTGLQVIYTSAEVAENLKAPRLVGTFTAADALTRLLSNTGLRYEYLDKRTIAIRPLPAAQTQAIQADAPLHLTQVHTEAQGETGSRDPQEQEEEKESSRSQKGIPEMLVKGSRSSNTDIERTEDDIQPYVVFNAEDIEASGAGNLAEFLMTRLPMNSSSAMSAQFPEGFTGNVSSISLRGMGASETLILVNGRRLPEVYFNAEFSQPDINGISPSSVKRIEVLPSTAGGIYGGGATGGVINIILKEDYRGVELNARYDNTFDSDASRRRLDGNAGFSLENGKTNVRISGSYSDANPLRIGDRDFLQRARALVLENNPASLIAGAQPPVGATTNIRSTSGAPLTLKSNGRSLGSPITHVPYGYAGPQSDNSAGLVANAGSYNLDLPRGTQGYERSMLYVPTVSSASLNVRRRFSERVEVFLDVSASRNESAADVSRYPFVGMTLQPSSPGNPFNQIIRVQFPGSDFAYGIGRTSTLDMLAAGLGMMVRLPRDWTAQAEHNLSRSGIDYAFSASSLAVGARLAFNTGGLTAMRDVEAYPQDYSSYYNPAVPDTYFIDPYETVLGTSTLRFAGPTLRLPGGFLMLSALLERRKEEAQSSVEVSNLTSNPVRYIYTPPRSVTTDSVYVEATAPLISASNARRWVRTFDLQASYRRDSSLTHSLEDLNYNSFDIDTPDGPIPDIPYTDSRVQANQFTLGLRYKPLESVALRVSYGAGVLPPSIYQVVPSTSTDFEFFAPPSDPKRGGELVDQILDSYILGGNASLQPEESRSWSTGMVFTPTRLPGLRLSVDYTHIAKSGEIDFLPLQTFLNMEDFLPGRIVRAALTDEDRANNYEGGVIQSIDQGLVNIADTLLEAYDFKADYVWDSPLGGFRAYLLATHTAHLRQQLSAESEETDSPGYVNAPLKWRGNGGVTWERNSWAAGWNMQYYDSYFVYDVTTDPFTAASMALTQGSSKIPRQMYHDVFVKLRFGAAAGGMRGMFADSEIMLGINNLFDTSPPIIATIAHQGGGYSTYGDARLRRYVLSLRKSF